MRGRLRLSLIVVGALTGLLAAGPAWAHSATVHYTATWSTTDRVAVKIYNDSTVTGAFLSRVLQGAKAWDNVKTTLNYDYVAPKNLSRKVCDTATRGKNLVYRASIDGPRGTAGITETCFTGKQILRFTMKFDSQESWHTSITTPVPSGKIDVASVAAHEFGHASGWRSHLAEASVCVNDSTQNTMCPTTWAGTSQLRTLHTHDVHTLDAAY